MCKGKLLLVLSLSCLFFLWSSTYTAVSMALNSFSPEGLALFRFLVASGVLFIISKLKKVRIPEKKDWPLIIVCGVIGVSFYNIILIYGQKTSTVALSSLLLNTYPIFVALFSFLMFKEIVNIFKWIGIIVCFLGMFIVSGGGTLGFNYNSSVLLLLLAAAIVSLFDLEQKQLMKKYTPFELTCYFIWIGTFFLTIFSGALLKDLSVINFKSLLPAIYLGAFPSVLASLIWAKLIVKYSVTLLSCCCYITPFFAMVIAFFVLHQVPGVSIIFGSLIVISGLFIITFSERLKLPLPQSVILKFKKRTF